MELKIPVDDQRLFDKWGNLSSIGMQKYWSELIQQIKLFDRSEIDLRPKGKSVPVPSRPQHGGKAPKKN